MHVNEFCHSQVPTGGGGGTMTARCFHSSTCIAIMVYEKFNFSLSPFPDAAAASLSRGFRLVCYAPSGSLWCCSFSWESSWSPPGSWSLTAVITAPTCSCLCRESNITTAAGRRQSNRRFHQYCVPAAARPTQTDLWKIHNSNVSPRLFVIISSNDTH